MDIVPLLIPVTLPDTERNSTLSKHLIRSESAQNQTDMSSPNDSASKGHVLVYHHQPKSSPAVKDGLAVISQLELSETLATSKFAGLILPNECSSNLLDPSLKLTRKPIKKGSRHVEIFQHDLWTDSEKDANKDRANANPNLADVHLSVRITIYRFLGDFKELLILSQKSGV